MQYDNPARRLHTILCEALAASKEIGSPSSVKPHQVWETVFGEGSREELLADLDRLQSLIRQSRDTVALLQQVPDRTIYLEALNELSESIHNCGLLPKTWPSLFNTLNQPLILNLIAAAANAIDNEAQILEITEAQQSEILESAQALLNEITASNIDKKLKIFITIRMEEVCQAIRHYGVNGSGGLKQVVEASIGSVVLRSAGFPEEKDSQSFLKRFISIMLKCGSWLGIAADLNGFALPVIGDAVVKLLPPSE